MSVQSRRKPNKLFTATVYGFIWSGLSALMICCVWGTLAEIRAQTIEGTEPSYIVCYFLSLLLPAVIAFCRMGGIEASKRLYITVQLVNFTVLMGVFWVVLDLAGGSALAFFLGNPEPGVVSAYETVFIWVFFLLGAILQILSVMNDRYRNNIRIGVGGILFVISILLPKALESYELLRAMCTSRLLGESYAQAGCPAEAIETIPMFTMAIAFSAALMVLFFVNMFSPAVERFISSQTGDDTGTQRNLPKQESESAVQPSYAEPLPSAVRRNSHCGSFAAAVLGGVVVWAIQAIGERATKRR
ncbi:hypothetical protein [Actinomyces sp.]